MVLRLIYGQAKDAPAKQELSRTFYRLEANAPHPGWLGGDIGFAVSDPLAFVMVERWGSRAAVEAWQSSQLWRDRVAQAGPLLAGPLQECLYTGEGAG